MRADEETPRKERPRVTVLRIVVVTIVVVCLAFISKPWEDDAAPVAEPTAHSKGNISEKTRQKSPLLNRRFSMVDQDGRLVRCPNGKPLKSSPGEEPPGSPRRQIEQGYFGHCGNDPNPVVIPYDDSR